MKYFKRSNMYKASNVSFDPTTMQAHSYNWWLFVDKIDGKVVFNSYGYSHSTRKHQSKVRALLRSLNINIDLEIKAPSGLDDLNDAIDFYRQSNINLSNQVKAKGSKHAKNEERRLEILQNMMTIAKIENLRDAKHKEEMAA